MKQDTTNAVADSEPEDDLDGEALWTMGSWTVTPELFRFIALVIITAITALSSVYMLATGPKEQYPIWTAMLVASIAPHTPSSTDGFQQLTKYINYQRTIRRKRR